MREGIDHALTAQPSAIAETARWFRGAPTSPRCRVGVKNRVTPQWVDSVEKLGGKISGLSARKILLATV